MSVRGTRIPPHLQLPIACVTPPPTEKEGQRLFPDRQFPLLPAGLPGQDPALADTPARPASRSRSTWTT